MAGAVGQQRVPKFIMENYPLDLPPVSEQTEIVRLLDDLLAKEQQAKEAAEGMLEQINLIKKPSSPAPSAVSWATTTPVRRARWSW